MVRSMTKFLTLETYDFSKAEITFFAAGGKISEKYAEKAAKHTTIIDSSSFFQNGSRCTFNCSTG